MDQKHGSGVAVTSRGPGAAHYRRLFAEQESSGKSLRAFARERGLSAWTLYDWRRRLGRARRRRSKESAGKEGGFVSVDVVGSVPAMGDIEVELSDGLRVRVPRDVTTERLVALVRALRSC